MPDPLSLIQEAFQEALTKYPRLSKLGPVHVQYGTPPQGGEGRYLEFYPPWESLNPNPGKSTLEVYDKALQGGKESLREMLAGDMLHLLGAIDPRTRSPVDPYVYWLKRSFSQSFSPQQDSINLKAFGREGEGRSYQDWLNQSRIDAYLRGYVFNQWPEEFFTPYQKSIGNSIRSYLGSNGL